MTDLFFFIIFFFYTKKDPRASLRRLVLHMHTAPTCTSDQVLFVCSRIHSRQCSCPEDAPLQRDLFFPLFSPALHPAYGQHSSSRFPPSFFALSSRGRSERATTCLCFGPLTKSTLNRLRSAALPRRPGCSQYLPIHQAVTLSVAAHSQPATSTAQMISIENFLEVDASRGSWSPVELTQKGDWEGGLRGETALPVSGTERSSASGGVSFSSLTLFRH